MPKITEKCPQCDELHADLIEHVLRAHTIKGNTSKSSEVFLCPFLCPWCKAWLMTEAIAREHLAERGVVEHFAECALGGAR